MNDDYKYRVAAFKWLELQIEMYGNKLPYGFLVKGFDYENQRITLASPRGIWKPRVFAYPISIRTAFRNPYKDDSRGGVLRYKYFQNDPNSADNVGLRNAMRDQIPLIYFQAISEGKYEAVWPVYVTNDNPTALEFGVSVDDKLTFGETENNIQASIVRREYLTTVTQVRLHQSIFREIVLQAYKEHCSFCNLHHAELLDAAHIIPDKDEKGIPHISNGLSLCKIHHAAFDKNILGVRPDYKIEVRDDVLQEKDGLMLQYGLQSLHKKDLLLPSKKSDFPSTELLEMRWEKFRKAI